MILNDLFINLFFLVLEKFLTNNKNYFFLMSITNKALLNRILNTAFNPEAINRIINELVPEYVFSNDEVELYLKQIMPNKSIIINDKIKIVKDNASFDIYQGLEGRIDINTGKGVYVKKTYKEVNQRLMRALFANELLTHYRVEEINDKDFILCPVSFVTDDNKGIEGGFALSITEDYFKIYPYYNFKNKTFIQSRLKEGTPYHQLIVKNILFQQKINNVSPIHNALLFLNGLINYQLFNFESNNNSFDDEWYNQLIIILSNNNYVINSFAPQKRYDYFVNSLTKIRFNECIHCKSLLEKKLFYEFKNFFKYKFNVKHNESLTQFIYNHFFNKIVNDEWIDDLFNLIGPLIRESGLKLNDELINNQIQSAYKQLFNYNKLLTINYLFDITKIRPSFIGVEQAVNKIYDKLLDGAYKSACHTCNGIASSNLMVKLYDIKDLFMVSLIKPNMNKLIRIHNKIIDNKILSDKYGTSVPKVTEELIMLIGSTK